MSNPSDLHDLTIVGGGPTGLFAAYHARFRGLTAIMKWRDRIYKENASSA